MAQANAVAATPCVQRLMFGTIDFQLELGIDGDGDELLAFRSQLVLASRLAGIQAPVDGPSTSWDDADLVATDARRARKLGFGGKLCIHPKQIASVNAAFSPSEVEVEWARKVVDAAKRSGGGGRSGGRKDDRSAGDSEGGTHAARGRRDGLGSNPLAGVITTPSLRATPP